MILSYFSREERLRRKASAWVARLHGTPTEDDRASFIRWYRADPANARAFDRVSAGFDAGLLLKESNLAQEPSASAARPRREFQYAVAAAILAAICVSLVLLLQERGSASPDGRFMLATQVGEVRVFPLSDGSRMTLDTDTAVAVDLSQARRLVTLQRGRARIAVSAARAPFEVSVQTATVSATEGVVDVALVDDRPVVAPIRGSVRLVSAEERDDGTPSIILAEGQRAVIGLNGAAVAARPLGRGETLWPTGMLEFDATPLSEAVAQANRYSREKIRLAPGAEARHRVTGAFRSGEVGTFARGLAAAFDLSIERLPNGDYLLGPRNR